MMDRKELEKMEQLAQQHTLALDVALLGLTVVSASSPNNSRRNNMFSDGDLGGGGKRGTCSSSCSSRSVLLLYTKGDRTPDNASLLIGLSMLKLALFTEIINIVEYGKVKYHVDNNNKPILLFKRHLPSWRIH